MSQVRKLGKFGETPSIPISIRGTQAWDPLFFEDVRGFGVIFPMPTERARKWLTGSAHPPVEMLPGQSLLMVGCFDYRKTDIGPYREIGVCVLVGGTSNGRPASLLRALKNTLVARETRSHVRWLPVNTEIALAGGLDFFGYPKTLERIELGFSEKENEAIVKSAVTGETLLELRCARRALMSFRDLTMTNVNYPFRDGKPLRAEMRFLVSEARFDFLPRHATLRFGEGAKTRWELDDPKGKALLAFDLIGAQALLPAPREDRD